MTAQEKYALTAALLRGYGQEHGPEMAQEVEKVIQDPWYGPTLYTEALDAGRDLLLTFQAEMERNTGRAQMAPAIKKLMAFGIRGKQTLEYARAKMFPAAGEDQMHWYAPGKYNALCLNHDVPKAPHLSEGEQPMIPVEAMYKVISRARSNTTKLVLPTVSAVQVHIAGHTDFKEPKKGGNPRKMVQPLKLESVSGDMVVSVNPIQLDLLLRVFPDLEIYADTPVKPLYLCGKSGEGVLSPVKPDCLWCDVR